MQGQAIITIISSTLLNFKGLGIIDRFTSHTLCNVVYERTNLFLKSGESSIRRWFETKVRLGLGLRVRFEIAASAAVTGTVCLGLCLE